MEPKKRQPKKTSEKKTKEKDPKEKEKVTPGRKGHSAEWKKKTFDDLIDWISEGKTMNAFVSEKKVAFRTLFDLIDSSEENKKCYVRAREIQAEVLFDKIQAVANDRTQDHTPFTGSNVIQRDKLIIDAIKWQISKVLPKKYGDRIEVDQKTEHSGSISVPITGMIIKSSKDKEEGK